MRLYRISGLCVACDLDLPGVLPGTCGRPDIHVESVDEIPDYVDPEQVGPTWAKGADGFVITVPGIARFRLIGGCRIEYASQAGSDVRDVAAFLLGSIFGILLHQRETFVLHSSAIQVGQRAVLFCGRSGAGKSTLAAAFNKRGFPLIADDVCAIDLAGPILAAQPDARCLRLWQDAGETLDLGERRGSVVRTKISKFHFEPHASIADEALPIAAVYVLREGAQAVPARIELLNLADAASTLRRQAYRPPLVSLLKQEELYFRGAALLAAQARIFDLVRPLRFELLMPLLMQLEQHWIDVGVRKEAA